LAKQKQRASPIIKEAVIAGKKKHPWQACHDHHHHHHHASKSFGPAIIA
jgi:hypothetical protein